MIRTFFVLDLDGTYDNEGVDNYGVQPVVYLIPEDRILEVQKLAVEAGKEFHDSENPSCIEEIFADKLRTGKIEYQIIGSIKITFGERQEDYLADYIAREIV